MLLIARRAAERNLEGLITSFPFLSVFNNVFGTRTSPAITTRFVVVSVYAAIRTVQGSMPCLRASL